MPKQFFPEIVPPVTLALAPRLMQERIGGDVRELARVYFEHLIQHHFEATGHIGSVLPVKSDHFGVRAERVGAGQAEIDVVVFAGGQSLIKTANGFKGRTAIHYRAVHADVIGAEERTVVVGMDGPDIV
ncbi:MAG TPA: hypothetical protein VNH18_23945, partial [Bryobacteraceae bacterium]|nr:hypothetical protein [Bryobacteraceae bacterium]